MVSQTSVIQELIPQLAASLGQLRRAPGKSDSWIGQVIVALEKHRDPRFDRIQRRIGFAQRLGEMAGLHRDDIALATLGVFFHELLPIKQDAVRASRSWREYLLRNEDWLRPALEVCEAIRSTPWEEADDPVVVVAKTSVVFDNETLEHHERPLVVVESIVAQANGHEAQRVVDLLWTEAGQALCDHHFRLHPRAYHIDPKELRRALAGLYRFAPRVVAGAQLQSMRSGDVTNTHGQETEVTQPVTSTNGHQEPADNFDRRRQALRTKRDAVAAEPDAIAPVPPSDDAAPEEPSSRIAAKLRAIESAERTTQQVEAVQQPNDAPTQTEPQPIREEQMNQLASIAPAPARGDALDVRDKLQELRIQLGQIQQIALQSEQLLAGIAPQVDDFAARIADVEAVLDRWNGRTRNAA